LTKTWCGDVTFEVDGEPFEAKVMQVQNSQRIPGAEEDNNTLTTRKMILGDRSNHFQRQSHLVIAYVNG
jgi:hypothetical protein